MLWQNEDEDEECKFDLLDDNCCYEILRCLPLVDLCALSRTCIRFYNLCNKQFQLEYPSKVMYIDDVDENGLLVKGPSQEKYVAAFDKSIRNIVLRGETLASKLDVVNAYYNQDESVNDRPAPIKHIILFQWFERDDKNGDDAAREDFLDAGRTLVNLLRTIETITFDYVWIETDWYDTFLRYTPNIKRLKIGYRCMFNERQHWLENAYPQLESLECYTFDELLPEKLNIFRRLNPNVRHVSLYAKSSEVITDWLKKDVKVDELFFYVNWGTHTYDLDFLKSKLNVVAELIKAQNTKLHLMLDSLGDESVSEDALIAQLTSLQSNIVGLYFAPIYPRIQIGKKLATAISKFESVRVLMMDTCEDSKIIAHMSKLEEIYIGARWDDFEDMFDTMYDTMRTLVGGAAKLKKMYVHNDDVPFTRFDFAQLDRERMKLKDACKLKIYVDSDEQDETGKLDDAERTFSRIEIIRSSTEPPSNPHYDWVTYQLCCKRHFRHFYTGSYL